MHATTVTEFVDLQIAPLVDALNASPLDVRTFASCSGHSHKRGLPYLAFRSGSWEALPFLLECVTRVNAVTRGQTHIRLSSGEDQAPVSASLRLTVYPWLWPERVDWSPVFVGWANPPRRLTTLWWRELAELARMVEANGSQPSDEFAAWFESEMRRETASPARLPWWYRAGQRIADGGLRKFAE